jgi:TPR repeat protein
MYYNGDGVAQDYMRAHMWLNLSSINGQSVFQDIRNFVASKMTSQQIAEAQKLARECQSRNFKNCD